MIFNSTGNQTHQSLTSASLQLGAKAGSRIDHAAAGQGPAASSVNIGATAEPADLSIAVCFRLGTGIHSHRAHTAGALVNSGIVNVEQQ